MNFLSKLFFFLLLSNSLTISAYSQDFKGTVIDSETNLPIPFADIYFNELNTGTTTDINGVFIIHHIHPKKIHFQIHFIGYSTIIEEVDLASITEKVFYLKPTHLELDEVIVSIPIGKLQSDNVVMVEQKKIIELQQSAPLTLAEAISNIVGVDQNTTGVGIGKPIIRGLSGNRIVTYAQGIRIENQQWGAEHGLGIGEVGIESVEVIKGPASLLYGSDALGGVLYFVDERYAKHNSIEGFVQSRFLSNTLGSINTSGFKLHNEKFLLNVFGAYSTHADYQTPTNKRVLNTRFNEKNIKVSVGLHNKNWISNLRYSFLQNDFGITDDAIFTTATNRSIELPFQKINNQNLSFENTLFTGTSSWDLVLGYTNNYRKEFENNSSVAALAMRLQTGTYNLKWNSPVINDKIELIIGSQGMFQMNQNNGAEILIPNATTFDIGGFTIVNIDLNIIQLQGGIRFDQRQIESKEMQDATDAVVIQGLNSAFNSINYSGGAVYTKDNFTLRANIASGFRAPNTSELLSNGVHEGTNRFEKGNPNLVSEQATQFDLSFDYQNEHIEFSVNPYLNTIQNYIFLTPTGDIIDNVPVYEYTQTRATLMGGEIGIHYHPHSVHWLHIESQLAMVYAEDADKNPLPLIPATNINTTIKVEFSLQSKFRVKDIFIQDIYKFEQDRASSFETITPAYNLINIGLNMEIETNNQPIEINAGIKNLFNIDYIDHLSRFKQMDIPNPGINLYIGLKVKFNQSLKEH